mmetsp:Transcript_17039/g.51077  ORF Transcript_17039/g.51077 Transcript_17039/m.51077 type:complete len:209 (-) Transcript_17039:1694-2320(-)
MQLGPCRAHTRPCGGETLPSASSALAAPPPLPPAPNGERSGEPPTTAAAAAESLRLSRLVFVRSAWRPAQRRAPPADTPPDGGDGGCAGDGSASRPPPARPCESACNSRASTSTADRSPTAHARAEQASEADRWGRAGRAGIRGGQVGAGRQSRRPRRASWGSTQAERTSAIIGTCVGEKSVSPMHTALSYPPFMRAPFTRAPNRPLH